MVILFFSVSNISFDFVYSHIKNLKKKLKEKGCGDMLQAVYGLGYKLVV